MLYGALTDVHELIELFTGESMSIAGATSKTRDDGVAALSRRQSYRIKQMRELKTSPLLVAKEIADDISILKGLCREVIVDFHTIRVHLPSIHSVVLYVMFGIDLVHCRSWPKHQRIIYNPNRYSRVTFN
jgi:hypothetical protein